MSRRILTLAIGLALALGLGVGGQLAVAAMRSDRAALGSATNADGTSGPPVNTAPPTLNATTSVTAGMKLRCDPGLWADDPTSFIYRWERDGHTITRATADTYRVTRADAGASVRCVVRAVNQQGTGGPIATLALKVRRSARADQRTRSQIRSRQAHPSGAERGRRQSRHS